MLQSIAAQIDPDSLSSVAYPGSLCSRASVNSPDRETWESQQKHNGKQCVWSHTTQIACWGSIPNPLRSQNAFCELRHFCKMTSAELWESEWEFSWRLWEWDVILTSHWEIMITITSSHSHENISGNLVTFLMECFAETRSRISGICVKEGIGEVPQQARSHCGAPQSLLAGNLCAVFFKCWKYLSLHFIPWSFLSSSQMFFIRGGKLNADLFLQTWKSVETLFHV